MPIAIKDNIAVKGMPMTCGSKILEKYIAPYDAEVIQKLKKDKWYIIGKTNLDEFAFGIDTRTSSILKTKNPLDEERVPGGSSGGSAASIASKTALIALGTDTCRINKTTCSILWCCWIQTKLWSNIKVWSNRIFSIF